MVGKHFVYSLVFSRTPDKSYRFLCFQKRERGYFYSTGGGTIYPDGFPIDTAGNFALPGGRFEGDGWPGEMQILAQCQKEFKEECGRQIRFESNTEIVARGGTSLEETVVQAVAAIKVWPLKKAGIRGYAAMYLQVPDRELNLVAGYIETCMAERNQAVLQITGGILGDGDYEALAAAFPMAPMDDEIHLMIPAIHAIPADGFAGDPLIASLARNHDTDWFSSIIASLPEISS